MLRTKLVILITTILLSACASQNVSETERSICRELARDLPSYSVMDTYETLRSGARFIEVFEAICQ